jgi:hypothetical protein
MVDGSLSALNADTDENKCGAVMVKLVFLITFTPVTLKCGQSRLSIEDIK